LKGQVAHENKPVFEMAKLLVKIDLCLDYKMTGLFGIIKLISGKYGHLLKFYCNLNRKSVVKIDHCLDFKMDRSLGIMRLISGKHGCLLKFF
jgi:hypothetical protein